MRQERSTDTHALVVDFIPLLFWSALELDVGIICANLPSIRILLMPFWSWLFPPRSKASSGGRLPLQFATHTIGSRGKPKVLTASTATDTTWGNDVEEAYIPLEDFDSNEMMPTDGRLMVKQNPDVQSSFST